MSEGLDLLRLHDLHLLEDELADPGTAPRLRRLGLAIEPRAAVTRERERALLGVDRRWRYLYERARGRYGRGVCPVKERSCQGCHIRLPTSVTNPSGALTLCESCGRILYWG